MTLNSSLQDEQFRYDCWVAEIPLYGLLVNILNSSLDSSEHLDSGWSRVLCQQSKLKGKRLQVHYYAAQVETRLLSERAVFQVPVYLLPALVECQG